VDAVAVCSEYLRSTFGPKSASLNAKTHIIFNGANLQTFYPREEVREPKTIFFVGRFDPQKGVLQLVQAYERVLHTHPDAKLVIGGTTGFGAHSETAYVRQVRDLALSLEKRWKVRIQFSGYLDHDKDLPLWYQKATVCTIPSIFQEPFGLVNAEAMACATAVVASNRGGIPEVIGDAGRLVDPENVDELASAISELLSKPQYCREFGRAGYERCQRMFDWRLTAKAWMALLDRVLIRTVSCASV
jgi:glycosyltransferase involved in cell wall biosynthesis